MASKDSSLYKGSDECDRACDVCQYQDVTSSAISYCNVCTEALCTACDKVHRASKQTRNHKLLTLDQLSSISGGNQAMPSVMTCDKHHLMIEYFCEAHNEVFCRTCNKTTHRGCDTTKIKKTTAKSNPMKPFADMKRKLNTLESAYEEIRERRSKDKDILKGQIEDCLHDVKAIRKEYNEVLRQLEEKMEAEIEELEQDISKEIDDHLVAADDTLGQIREKMTTLEECEKSGTTDALFVGLKKSEGEVAEYEKIITDLEKELKDIDIYFKPNDALLKDMKSIGQLKRHGQIQETTSIMSMAVYDMEGYDSGSDKVQTVMFMTNNQIVIACIQDGLKLLDAKFQEISHVSIRASFACKCSNTEVLVSQGRNKKLQFFDVRDKLVPGEVLDIGEECWGVHYRHGEIFIACNATIQVLERNGTFKRRLTIPEGKFTQCMRMKFNTSGSKLFISDFGNNTVTCLDQNGYGHVVYRFSHPSIKDQGDIYIDDYDNVLVCGGLSHKVTIINADGKSCRTLLEKNDGIRDPKCVDYRPSDGRLVIGSFNYSGKCATLFLCKTTL